ncbi:MAG: NfeD family protein [Planctomycetota bacterium]
MVARLVTWCTEINLEDLAMKRQHASGWRHGNPWSGRRLVGLIGAALFLIWPLATAQAESPAAVVIPIRGEINDVLKGSIERRLEAALDDGAKTIIFEMDTPGGLVTSALDICRMIKNLPEDVVTVAWVHPDAYSAGAMISVACQRILMGRSASIGDCAPIMINPAGGLQELPTTERAKAESPVLQEFRDSATRNGYNQILLRAMVTVGEEVWWVEDVKTGERRFVNGDEKQRLLGEGGLSFDDDDASLPEWRLVENYIDPQTQREVPAKQPVDAANELLTLSQSDAVAYGIALGIAEDLVGVTELLELNRAPVYMETTSWEEFVIWLNSPLVRGILFIIVLIGAYIEFQSPGLILPGATAAVALVIFLAAPYAAGLADVWTFVLLGIGIILLMVEIFVIPGFGVTGILGILLILVAFIGTFVPAEPVPQGPNAPWFNWPSLPATWEAMKVGILVLSSSVIIGVMGILLIVRYLPQLSLGRGLIAANPSGPDMALADFHPNVALVGDIGVVTGDLRPGGSARFGQEIVDVQSQGEYVEAGRRVQVLKRGGMEIFVRPLPEDNDA